MPNSAHTYKCQKQLSLPLPAQSAGEEIRPYLQGIMTNDVLVGGTQQGQQRVLPVVEALGGGAPGLQEGEMAQSWGLVCKESGAVQLS